ncbi:MAG: hypothetical protein HY862_00040 [Chloroflexi bacterium]|nr:hypothetical protein [Chloroflexota bacterium]
MLEAENLIFESYNRVAPTLHGYDSVTRNLSGIQQLFTEAGLPFDLVPTITVTGSKGKGSTSIFSAALLQGMGHTVGLMTSPSFLNVRERIRVNGQAIFEAAFVEIMHDLAPIIRRIEGALPPDQYLSPTGLFLACAIRYFMQCGVTAMVLEVGRGGRFDDVRLIENQVSCFTPIMAEHLDKLGPTVADIVWHKTGIIKANSIAISAPQPPEVSQQIEQACQELGTTFQQVGRDISFEQRSEINSQVVVIEGNTFKINTPAVYQATNLATAYAAVQALAVGDMHQPKVAQTIRAVHLPGRCDRVSDVPLVLIDGAINRESAEQFRDSVLPFSRIPIILVTALPHDKDHVGLLATLMPYVAHTIVTQVSAQHLHFTDGALQTARQFSAEVTHQPAVFEAFAQAIGLAGQNGTIWVVGTQSLVRDALQFWQQDLEKLIPSNPPSN